MSRVKLGNYLYNIDDCCHDCGHLARCRARKMCVLFSRELGVLNLNDVLVLGINFSESSSARRANSVCFSANENRKNRGTTRASERAKCPLNVLYNISDILYNKISLSFCVRRMCQDDVYPLFMRHRHCPVLRPDRGIAW